VGESNMRIFLVDGRDSLSTLFRIEKWESREAREIEILFEDESFGSAFGDEKLGGGQLGELRLRDHFPEWLLQMFSMDGDISTDINMY
jgi:hypothetical protein